MESLSDKRFNSVIESKPEMIESPRSNEAWMKFSQGISSAIESQLEMIESPQLNEA